MAVTPTARRAEVPARYDDGSVFRTRHAAVYHLEPPLTVERENGVLDVLEHVIVSTTETLMGTETMAFACDDTGTLLSWEEIEGRGCCDEHAVVLLAMGYPYVIAPTQRAIEEGGPGSDSYTSFAIGQ
jgi:hypothetical protein